MITVLALCFAYFLIGVAVGVFLFYKYPETYDEPGGTLCGMFWPLSLPTILVVYLTLKLTHKNKNNWERR